MANNLLRSGAEYMRIVFRSRESITVTYKRGASSYSVSATVGRTRGGVDLRTGLRANLVESRDFIISRSDLTAATAFNDADFTPLPGDEILETDGSLTHTYELAPPEGQVDVWSWHSLYRTAFRIHAVRTGTT